MTIAIEPNRSYPIKSGPNSGHAFVTGIDPQTKMVSYYRVPFGLHESDRELKISLTAFAALVRCGALERQARFQPCVHWEGHQDHAWFVEELAKANAVLEGKLPPEGSIFDEIRISIAVMPSPTFDEATRGCDFWGHIDSLTGGCCNTLYSNGAYEATVYGVQHLDAFTRDLLVGDVVAVTFEAPDAVMARPDLPLLIKSFRADLPTISAMRIDLEQARASSRTSSSMQI